MRFATEPPRLRVAVLAVLAVGLLVSGYVAVQLANRVGIDRNRSEDIDRAGPPPGADDPSNRGIFIEGGTSKRGSTLNEEDVPGGSPWSRADEDRRPLVVAGFWMQEHEVTNEEFLRYDADHRFPSGQERHPVANVTWEDAMAYAAFVGGTLPTEAQWAFAAKGTEGRKYPWGDSEPTCERAQYGECAPRGTIEVMTRPAGATPEGVHDLAGNVWEWVMPDWFEPGRTPVNDESRRLRGGSFDDEAFFIRASNRNKDFFSGFKYVSIGFRVVWAPR